MVAIPIQYPYAKGSKRNIIYKLKIYIFIHIIIYKLFLDPVPSHALQ